MAKVRIAVATKKFQVAFTYERGGAFHQGVALVSNCLDAIGAENWFRVTRGPFFTVDAVWEA